MHEIIYKSKAGTAEEVTMISHFLEKKKKKKAIQLNDVIQMHRLNIPLQAHFEDMLHIGNVLFGAQRLAPDYRLHSTKWESR